MGATIITTPDDKNPPFSSSLFFKKSSAPAPPLVLVLLLGALLFFSFSFFSLHSSSSFFSFQTPFFNQNHQVILQNGKDELGKTLEKASRGDKTVIITVINKAYVEREEVTGVNMLDLFLEGFWVGEGTRELVRRVMIVAMDETAYKRCLFRGLHCYKLETEGVDFMREEVFESSDFVKMTWRRTLFLIQVLDRGYNFIFTDTDVMWLRNPFPILRTDKTRGFDIQFSTDYYNGNPSSIRNPINTGFYFVKSNNKTITLFNKWYALKDKSGGAKEQDVLQKLITQGVLKELDLTPRFLDTKLFSGFCQDSSDIRSVITVHSNCCRYIKAKVTDLSRVLGEWGTFKVTPANATSSFRWSRHVECRNSWNSTYGGGL